jgi:hypothetical protein
MRAAKAITYVYAVGHDQRILATMYPAAARGTEGDAASPSGRPRRDRSPPSSYNIAAQTRLFMITVIFQSMRLKNHGDHECGHRD